MVPRIDLDLVIFDWDGTLVNSLGAILDCFEHARKLTNLPPVDLEYLRSGIGLTFERQMERMFPDVEVDHDTFIKHYYDRYYSLGILATDALVEGVMKVFDYLADHSIRLAIATGKVRADLDKALQAHGIEERFAYSVAGDEARSKPDPEMVKRILAELDVEPSRALMLGDNALDILTARGAGVDGVAVLTGVQQDFSDVNPLAVLPSVRDLPGFLQAGEGVVG